MNNESKIIKSMVKTIVIGLIVLCTLEVFVFNYKTFIYSNASQKVKLSAQEAKLTGLVQTEENVYRVEKDYPTIEYTDIDKKVKILYFDCDTVEATKRLPVVMNYTDATRKKYGIFEAGIDGIDKEFNIVHKYNPSKYFTCNYFGNTQNIKFIVDAERGSYIYFNGVNINQTPPVNFSIIRVLILLIGFIFVYLMYKSKNFQKEYDSKNTIHKAITIITILGFIVVIIVIFAMYTGGLGVSSFKATYGNQVSKELVDAFEKGQTALLNEPGKDVLALENPYDYTQRAANNVKYLWDHVLYEGKYYSYYGIAPVLLVFLPYHMITGYYLSVTVCCLLSAIIGSIFIGLTYLNIVKKWLKNTPFWLVLSGLVMMLFSCGTLFCVVRPSFYENAETFAFMMFALSSYFIVNSGIFTQDKLKYYKLVLGSLFIGLSVLSRPTFAMYAISTVVIILVWYITKRKSMHIKVKVKYWSAVMTPLIILGSIQMIYNYIRFDSIMDFGIQYSLTINDFTNTTFNTKLGFVTMWSFLFSIPGLKSSFPFLVSAKDTFGLNGVYYSDTPIMTGLFIRVLPMFAVFYIPVLVKVKQWKLKDFVKKLALYALWGLIFPLIIIIATWESGHALRYNIDFGSQMLLFALFIIFTVYNGIKNTRIRRILKNICIICVLWCVISTLLTIFQYIPNETRPYGYSDVYTTINYYKLSHILTFWN